MSKKHYQMGGEGPTQEEKKQAGIATSEAFDTTKSLLEKQAEKPTGEIDVKKLIEIFPWRPHQDRVVVLPDPSDYVLPSGIIIPDTATEKPQSGVVIALGSEISTTEALLAHIVAIRMHIDSSYVPNTKDYYITESVPGDRVLFGKYAGLEITVQDVKYLVMRFADVIATVK